MFTVIPLSYGRPSPQSVNTPLQPLQPGQLDPRRPGFHRPFAMLIAYVSNVINSRASHEFIESIIDMLASRASRPPQDKR